MKRAATSQMPSWPADGEDAKVIGNLLIRDTSDGANADHLRAADDIRRWAGDEGRRP
jgi:hypothetical protein